MSRLLACLVLLLTVACSTAHVSADAKAAPQPRSAPVDGIELNPMSTLPKSSPPSTIHTTVTVTNTGTGDVQWDWLDFEGKLVRYAALGAGEQVEQPTYADHVWIISKDGVQLGWFAATEMPVDVMVH